MSVLLGERQLRPGKIVASGRAYSNSRSDRLSHTVKRAFDILVASTTLLILSPFFLLVAILIKLDSSGSVFFVQERIGSKRRVEHGRVIWEVKVFPFYKFRSMYHNSDESLHAEHIRAYVAGEIKAPKDNVTTLKLKDDPRITRVGKWIRKLSIDELPQLINVLKGEMSLVGPRPVPVYEFDAYDPWHRERLSAFPGITGYWQVCGRGIVPFSEQMRMDIEYVRKRSLWLDLKLLLLTIPAVITGRGAE
jgi:lipopolysaccharide/colanic/teichoic acid biosynthesis glycosyltransferase